MQSRKTTIGFLDPDLTTGTAYPRVSSLWVSRASVCSMRKVIQSATRGRPVLRRLLLTWDRAFKAIGGKPSPNYLRTRRFFLLGIAFSVSMPDTCFNLFRRMDVLLIYSSSMQLLFDCLIPSPVLLFPFTPNSRILLADPKSRRIPPFRSCADVQFFYCKMLNNLFDSP